MENVNNKRLQALKSRGAEKIFEAYLWVQEHRSEFKKEIYGPVLLEVQNPKTETRMCITCVIIHYANMNFCLECTFRLM